MAKKKYNRSGILFILIILTLLGLVLYAYKDSLMVFFKTNINSGKGYFSKKISINDKKHSVIKKNSAEKKESILDKINFLEKKEEDKTVKEQPLEKTVVDKPDNKDIKDKKNTTVQKEKETSDKNTKITEKDNVKIDVKSVKDDTVKTVETKKQENSDLKSQIKKVYFSRLNPNDTLDLVTVNRTIFYTNTPLTETLKTLISGPSQSEKNSNIITNIPESTKLLSVSIRNNIAYVNLSKDFEYNSYGRESTLAQLKQIIYTTLQFTNIKSVQILIEDKVKTYLGGEGILINKPLTAGDL